ncbi:uncharacterized protein LOC118749165 [Rhagoletis pomonella]|uniref:uncharacterized protein LOC118749165 n=1 Tax=Rhagoletis pomonella TaxID=28610 RepID=UPI00177E4E9C|nr:uncharacterized protein LOC118749165 [Rhagoletis pomonella]
MKTKKDLNKNVDPSDLKISNVHGRKSGTIVIKSENESERDKIKTAIANKMSDRYEIRVPNTAKPKFMAFGVSLKYESEQLAEMIKKQKECLKSAAFEIIKYIEVKKDKSTYYNVLIKTDVDTFSAELKSEKINIGWEKCRVQDDMGVSVCYKCKGFNHIATKCKDEEVCLKYLGNHKTMECTKEQINKCINCIRANKKFNLRLDVNHLTINRQCPVYMKKLEHTRNRASY